MNPKITVVIPCYNHGAFLDEAVNSVLAQTMQEFEIVVVDDGSTDEETARVLRDSRWPKTVVYRTENRGPSAARNTGIRRSAGEYLCCLDADDLLEPTCLEKTSRVLDEEPDVGIAGFWYRTFGEEEAERTPAGCTLEDILGACILRPTALFRREAWNKSGGFDERFKSGYEDWDFWIGVMERGWRARIIPEFLFRQRVQEGSRNTESDRPEVRARFMEEMIRKHEAVYREHAIPALMQRESLIGELRDWTRQQDEAKRWYLARIAEHERRIARLDAELELQAGEMQALQEESVGLERRYAAHDASLEAVRRAIEAREEELRSMRSSREWRLGCAFQEAKRSPCAALLLPFRALRFGLGRRGDERAEGR